jgi:ADP-heptose:LPS heptosyltransferase/SAM-dependent methyltransferase
VRGLPQSRRGDGMTASTDVPLVSAIMPTANRRAFVAGAIGRFLAQDYENAELIILDDGDDAVGDLIPDDPSVRYIRAPRFKTLGGKRNAAVEAAGGEIILHWDDDDWYAPDRIRAQVEALLASGADLCGLDRPLFIDTAGRSAWRYVYPPGGPPWVHGATFCYRRDLWRGRRFDNIQIGEDTRFAAAVAPDRLCRMGEAPIFVGLLHPGNTSRKNLGDSRWRAHDLAEVRGLTGPGWPAAESRPVPPPRPEAGSALVAAACGLGDILRVTPLIRALALMGHKVDVVLAPDNPATAELLRGAPEINDLHVVADSTRGHAAPLPEAVRGRTYAFAGFTRWATPLAGQVTARQAVHFQPGQWFKDGDTACVTALAAAAGWSGPLPAPFAMTSDRRFDLPAGTVGLHPGCKPDWPWKRWHGFAELAARLAEVAIVGTASDRDTAATYFKAPFAWPAHARDFTGVLSLRDTAALISQCSAMVANDSGLMHLAVALGVPTVGVFGITSPAREAMASPHMHALSKGLACESACRQQAWGRRDCSHHLECLKSLTADEVLDRLAEVAPVLAKARRPHTPQAPAAALKAAAPVTFRRVTPDTDPIRLAVHMEGGLGDLIINARLVEAAYRALGDCRIDVFYHSPDAAAFVFAGTPFVSAVHSDRGGFHPERTHDLSLYAQHYAHFVTYRPERLQRLRPEALSWLRIAAERFVLWRGFYERRPSLDGLWGRMSTAQGRNILDNLGFLSALPLDRHSPVLISPDPAALDGVAALLAPSHDPRFKAGYVTVHDGFDNTARIAPGQATKCWPIDSWTRMVAALRAARPDLAIVQLGAAKSRPISGVHIGLLGQTSLAQTAWILKGSALHIDTDSGLVHLARAVHTRSVALFGPTDTGLYGHDDNINLRAGDCADCWWSTPDWLSRCPRGLPAPACMAAIAPSAVADTAVKLLTRENTGPAVRLLASGLFGAKPGKPPGKAAAAGLKEIFGHAGLAPVSIREHARDPESAVYLHASKQWEYPFALAALDHAAPDRDGGRLRVLDAGGGRGALSLSLAARGCDVALIDPDFSLDGGGDGEAPRRFLAHAAARGVVARYGGPYNLPARDGAFDAVVCVSALGHARHQDWMLRELLRVLKPGGVLALTFDIAVIPEIHEDGLRVGVLSAERLDKLLTPLGVSGAVFSAAAITASAEAAARDQVAGLPEGLTVGGVLLRKA